MSVKGNSFDNSWLLYVFNNTAIAGIGDTNGLQPSATAGSLYVSLHTADPGAAGNQSTSEAVSGGYARVAVARSSAGWTVTGGSVSPTSNIVFPTQASNAAPQAVTYGAIGTSISGVGVLLYRWLLTTPITLSPNFTASILSTSTVVET